ncbi:D-lyxose ketol-isomerase [Rhizobium aquaticum]|uniref:D-lyxose ketol-isomerase n=1 Tax=Rhizobium aquaticum TaxID=1549636 RepID=A0ABV2J4L2_9HYPH
MKRSEINAALRAAQAMLDGFSWSLPSWGHWTASDFAASPHGASYFRSRQLGWDVTDFGLGRFAECGLTLFCLRNGITGQDGERTYAEKLLFVEEGQLTPTHRHKAKMEDIINRAGGTLVIEFSATNPVGDLSEEEIIVPVDGIDRRLKQWQPLELTPGESVTIMPGLYHRFYGKPGNGPVLVGEVSQVNDDRTDNFFLEPVGRFSDIEEDEPPLRPLWNEGAA